MLPLRDDYLPMSRPSFGPEEENELLECLRSGWITTGPRTRLFEERFREFTGLPHAVAVNSGTSALHLAMAALGVGPGDEVLTTTFTWVSTATVVIHCGGVPVLCDIDPDTRNIDPDQVERLLEQSYRPGPDGPVSKASGARLKAMTVVHYAALMCDMDRLCDIAARHKLALVEDAAHAVGSYWQGRHAGAFGDLGCFSFYANKNMTTAEGGMVVTASDELADRVRKLHMHGLAKDAWKRYAKGGAWYQPVVAPGFKYNMTDLAAALGLHQLAKVEGFNQRRRELSALYDQGLSGLPGVSLQKDHGRGVSARHIYTISLLPEAGMSREDMIPALAERNIGVGVHYIPVHMHPFYQEAYGYGRGDFPQAERIYDGVLSLPLFPDMTDQDAAYVIDSVRGLLGR